MSIVFVFIDFKTICMWMADILMQSQNAILVIFTNFIAIANNYSKIAFIMKMKKIWKST